MKRPEMSPQNHEELYEYYRHKVPKIMDKKHRLALKTALAISRIVRPEIDFPESHRAALQQAVKASNGVIVASNHIQIKDFAVIGSLVRTDPDIRSLADNVVVLAKSGLMKTKARWIIEGIGGIPAFRAKDRGVMYEGSRGEAPEKMIQLVSDFVSEGYNLKIFPEGTYCPDKVGKIEKGIGRVACKVMQLTGEPVCILPLGVEYKNSEQSERSAVAVGMPFMAEQAEHTVLEQVADALTKQRSVAGTLL